MRGEVSEWFKEPVLKTGDPATGHGFESHPLRQNKTEGCGQRVLPVRTVRSGFCSLRAVFDGRFAAVRLWGSGKRPGAGQP